MCRTREENAADLQYESEHSEPTYMNQVWQARKLLMDKGVEALRNPHAMTGLICGCGDCFCCAALEVLREYGDIHLTGG